MSSTETVLKSLLRQQHLQEHSAFRRAYDRAAAQVDKGLVGGAPSKATFYRWLGGNMSKLPHPGNCRVLEAMLPGWTAQQLFKPWDAAVPPQPELRPGDGSEHGAGDLPQVMTRDDRFADLSAVFPSRTEFTHELPPSVLFDNATSVACAGLSLNMLCQQYGDRGMKDLLDAGCSMRLLFLQPRGAAIAQREAEERLKEGHLSTLTELNIEVIDRLRSMLSAEAVSRLEVRTYDECVRFNITLVNGRTCVVQPYLPDARGLDAPTMVADKVDGMSGLFDIFSGVFESIWDRGAIR